MNNKPRLYKSPILKELIGNISLDELQKTESKMRLALKIDDAIKSKGFSKTEFAKKINKNNSEISKWLSGTHNFTHDTLILLQNELDISLVNSEIIANIKIHNIQIAIQTTTVVKNNINFFKLFKASKPDYINTYSFVVN